MFFCKKSPCEKAGRKNVENSIYAISFYTVLFYMSSSMYAGVLRNTNYSAPA